MNYNNIIYITLKDFEEACADRRETIGERCQNKMGIIQAPFRPPKMLPRHTQVGRIWVTQAWRECGPAIYRLPARTSQFILSCRDRQLVNELSIEVEKYTKLRFIRDSRKKFHYLRILKTIYCFGYKIIEDQVNIVKKIKGNYLFR